MCLECSCYIRARTSFMRCWQALAYRLCRSRSPSSMTKHQADTMPLVVKIYATTTSAYFQEPIHNGDPRKDSEDCKKTLGMTHLHEVASSYPHADPWVLMCNPVSADV